MAFTAANVFFGLKAGLTFATSIPAAVISMALLRNFKNSTIQENNIVQTVASAAGTLSSIIFVLPGLVIIGWWTGFPYWASFAICALGGILGVMYSIPLRRALVTNSDLPYPEGVACAEVLKVGSPATTGHRAEGAEESRAGPARGGLGRDRRGGVRGRSSPRACSPATSSSYFQVGDGDGGVTGFDFALSMALFAVGHLVGLWVGLAMLLGALIGWGWGVPHFSALLRRDRQPRRPRAGATWSHAGALRRRRHDRRRRDLDAAASWSSRWSAAWRRRWRPTRVRKAGNAARRCRAPNTTSRSASSA